MKNNFEFIFNTGYLPFLQKKFQYTVLSYDSTSLLLNDFNLVNSVNSFNDESFKNFDSCSLKGNLFFLLNADNFNCFYKDHNFLKDNTVVFQSIYNASEQMKEKINFFLPSALFIEKNATYINFFGLIQKVKFILFSFKNVRSDFKILYILFKNFLPKMNKNIVKFFENYNFSTFTLFMPNLFFSNLYNFFSFNNTFNANYITNFYKTNSILRRSKILSVCYKDIKNVYSNFF